jgi:DNA polymerase elongation subunit (family B)
LIIYNFKDFGVFMKLEHMTDEDLLKSYKYYSDEADKGYIQLGLDYSLKDTFLIQRLEDETALISLVLTVAYGGGVNYREAFGTTSIWETTIYRKMMLDKKVPPIKKNNRNFPADIVGGYVKDPVPGIYDWVVTFDLTSLYPHLMLQYNMSPETYSPSHNMRIPDGMTDFQDLILDGKFKRIENLEYSVGANGVCFDNRKLGIIPQIIEEYYAERSRVKKKMLSVESQIERVKEEIESRKTLKKEQISANIEDHNGLERKRYKL